MSKRLAVWIIKILDRFNNSSDKYVCCIIKYPMCMFSIVCTWLGKQDLERSTIYQYQLYSWNNPTSVHHYIMQTFRKYLSNGKSYDTSLLIQTGATSGARVAVINNPHQRRGDHLIICLLRCTCTSDLNLYCRTRKYEPFYQLGQGTWVWFGGSGPVWIETHHSCWCLHYVDFSVGAAA